MSRTRPLEVSCIALALAIVSVDLLLPLGGDNAVYQTIGWDLAAFGKLPLLGSWTHTLPGVPYLHALVISVFGTSDLGFRIFDLVLETFTSWLFYRLLVRRFSPIVGLVAVALYALIYVSLTIWSAGQPDAMVLPFLFGGITLLYQARSRSNSDVLYLLSGSVCSYCVLIRPTYALWVVSVLLVLLVERSSRRVILYFILGCAVGSLLPLIPYLFVTHGIRELYLCAVRFNLDVYGSSGNQHPTLALVMGPYSGMVWTLIALGGVSCVLFKRGARASLRQPKKIDRFDLWLWSSLTLSSLLSVVMMGKYFSYHFLPFWALMCPVMAFGLLLPVRILPWRGVGYAVSFAALAWVAYKYYPRNIVHHFADGLRSKEHSLDYVYRVMLPDTLTGYAAESDALNYIRTRISPAQRVEVLCTGRPLLRTRGHFESATRFSRITPLRLEAAPGLTEYQREWQREFVDDIKTRKPALLIIADDGFRAFVKGSVLEEAAKIPGFEDLLMQHYTLDTVIHGFTLYRSRSIQTNG